MSMCCGGSSRKNAAAFGVLTLLLVIACVGWWLEAHKGPPALPPVETVEVVVATTDMTTGTAFTKYNIGTLTTTKTFRKSEINPEAKIITDPNELIGKRLKRAKHAGEYFNATDMSSNTTIVCGFGRDIMSLPMSSKVVEASKVGPGSRVDIVASFGEGTERVVFTLLPDLTVFAVNEQDRTAKAAIFPPDMSMVSCVVDGDQAKLIALANQANCTLELLLRHPDAPKRDFDYDATLARVKALLEKQVHVAPRPREVGER